MQDNPLFQFQLTQQSTDPQIYFDDEEEIKSNISNAIPYIRLLFTMFIEASEGDMNKLQTIMCLFAGHSLREVSAWNKKSHESNRTVLESLKNKYPKLYDVIKEQRYKVPVINPNLNQKCYELYDVETQKTYYYSSLVVISKKYKIDYDYLRHYDSYKLIHKRFKIKRVKKNDGIEFSKD